MKASNESAARNEEVTTAIPQREGPGMEPAYGQFFFCATVTGCAGHGRCHPSRRCTTRLTLMRHENTRAPSDIVWKAELTSSQLFRSSHLQSAVAPGIAHDRFLT